MNDARKRAAEILRGFITGVTTPGGYIIVMRGTPGVLADLSTEAAAWQLLDDAGVANVVFRVQCSRCRGSIQAGIKYRNISDGTPFSWDTLRDTVTPEGDSFRDEWDDPYGHAPLCTELTEMGDDPAELEEGAQLRVAAWFADAVKAAAPPPSVVPPLNVNVRAVRRLAQALIDELPDDGTDTP